MAGGRHLVDRLAPQGGDLVGALQALQAGDGGVGHVDAVGGAERLGQDVADAGHLQDGPGRAAGDDAGTGGGRLQHDPAGTALPDDGVGDGGAGQRHVEHVLAGLFDALLHGEAGLLGLAVAEADAAVAVADDHEGGEGEPTTALDDLGHPVHPDGPLLELQLVVVHSHLRTPVPRPGRRRPARPPARDRRIRRGRRPRW